MEEVPRAPRLSIANNSRARQPWQSLANADPHSARSRTHTLTPASASLVPNNNRMCASVRVLKIYSAKPRRGPRGLKSSYPRSSGDKLGNNAHPCVAFKTFTLGWNPFPSSLSHTRSAAALIPQNSAHIGRSLVASRTRRDNSHPSSQLKSLSVVSATMSNQNDQLIFWTVYVLRRGGLLNYQSWHTREDVYLINENQNSIFLHLIITCTPDFGQQRNAFSTKLWFYY